MQRPAQFDFPLDVDDLAGPHPHARRDPCRTAEAEAADTHDGQSVYLADGITVRVDQDDIAGDVFQRVLPDPVGPVNAFGNGTLDILVRDAIVSRLFSPVVGLTQQIRQRPDPQGHALSVIGHARGLVDHAGNTGRRQRLQFLPY